MPEDFQVNEVLGFEPDGEGEHVWVRVRKTGHNTRDLIDILARQFCAPVREVGYSGLKDKHAVTTQWLSLPTAGSSTLDMSASESELLLKIEKLLLDWQGVEVVQVTRSRKKLRTGAHRKNEFKITLRQLKAPQDQVEQRLTQLVENGFPNYFGPQRFGREGRNVAAARSMFTGKRKTTRFKRGIYLSAARSCLFNQVLAARVSDKSWFTVLPGEACILDGTNSVFYTDKPDPEIVSRSECFDIHPSGPLHGRGKSMVTGLVADLESNCLQNEEALMQGLENAGLKQERRALRAVAQGLNWAWPAEHTLELNFTLQRGIYATSLLRELVRVQGPFTHADRIPQASSDQQEGIR